MPTPEYDADERTLCDTPTDDERYVDRASDEVSEGDHDILESEDERERLLIQKDGGGISGMFAKKTSVKLGRPTQKKQMKERRKGQTDESRALMYELEEGIGVSSTSLSSLRTSESDELRLRALRAQKQSRKSQIRRRLCIYILIIILFVILLTAAYRISKPRDRRMTNYVSNGTSFYAPTTILISLDGFRADFLYRNITPTLNRFVQEGISPPYMLPSFPSVTFPNHYTMATGLYPEAHGIVGNSFWDSDLQAEFFYTDPERSLQAHWWGGEPIWVTAEKQKVRAAVHMWPGSEAHILEQEIAYVDKFNGSELLSAKVNRIMNLLDAPGLMDVGVKANAPRPQLIAAYVPNVDSDGHRYGPNSTEIHQTIASVDTMLANILSGLHARNLTNIVNVVVVSDHGMATTDLTRLIQLEDLVDPADIEHIDGWPLYGLRPKDPNNLHRLYAQIKDRTKENPNVEVYLRDEDMPERYHFSQNERIAPLWIVPKAGWAITSKAEFDVAAGQKKGDVYHPRGLHGYDFEHPLMRAIFVARGPAFPHVPGSRMEPFQNIELYNIICDTLSVTPAPNNGTLRLPLKPVGHHNDATFPPPELPADPATHTLNLSPPTPQFSTTPTAHADADAPPPTNFASMPSTPDTLASFAASASGQEETLPWNDHKGPRPSSTPTIVGEAPAAHSSAPPGHKESWWEWLTHKAEGMEEWVEGVLKGLPGQNQTAKG